MNTDECRMLQQISAVLQTITIVSSQRKSAGKFMIYLEISLVMYCLNSNFCLVSMNYCCCFAKSIHIQGLTRETVQVNYRQ